MGEDDDGMGEKILEMNGIYKSFTGIHALKDVNLTLYKGEVLALVGENGAGKSTLMKILSGAYRLDSGEIHLNGRRLGRYTPYEAIKMGISVIYQELNDLRTLSIAENIYLGHLPVGRFGLVDYKKLRSMSLEAQKRVGMDQIDPFENVGNLRVAQKQLVEIARAIVRKTNILVMDEPTAPLTDKEVEKLYEIIREFTTTGGSVILITHKLDEVFKIADRVMVLRDGQNVTDAPVGELTKDDMIEAMVGHEFDQSYADEEHLSGEVLLSVKNLSTGLLQDISFDLRAGQVVGLYGLMGAGCENVTRCIYGVENARSGEFILNGKPFKPATPADNLKAGIAFVPSERKTEGVLLGMNVRTNITLSALKDISPKGLMDFKQEKRTAQKWIDTLRIKTADMDDAAASLSGGNQQKLVFAKAMNTTPSILILNEPTRGVDVGAKAEIYRLMNAFLSRGVGIIMVSSEMPETMSMSDEVVVLHDGKMTGHFTKGNYTQLDLIRAAIGEE